MKQDRTATISIIIPVLDEEKLLPTLLRYIQENTNACNIEEILVVDGGSKDNTIENALCLGATVLRSKKGRAVQMNTGAKVARGRILYFLHADTLPPKDFDQTILRATDNGHAAGCFRLKFDVHSPFLGFFAWCSRLNLKICRGGDQTLFVERNVFVRAKGFNEAYVVYEDSEFISRLYKITNFLVLPEHVTTSARKYQQIGLYRLQYHFGMIHLKNYLGAGPDELYQYYKRNIAM